MRPQDGKYAQESQAEKCTNLKYCEAYNGVLSNLVILVCEFFKSTLESEVSDYVDIGELPTLDHRNGNFRLWIVVMGTSGLWIVVMRKLGLRIVAVRASSQIAAAAGDSVAVGSREVTVTVYGIW